VTNSWSKLVRSLQQKKFRYQERAFLVEGQKSVLEALQAAIPARALFYTDAFAKDLEQVKNKINCPVFEVKAADLEKNGTLQSNAHALLVANMSVDAEVLFPTQAQTIVLYLDQINDPGNLGTIIRIADWYGINYIYTSNGTVDWTNPKTIAASKGSFLRVQIQEIAFENLYKKLSETFVFYAAAMEGEIVWGQKFNNPSVLILGNEANGISNSILNNPKIQKITIPKIGHAESLNVGMAAAILCDRMSEKSSK